MKKDIKNIQKHIEQLEKTLAKIPFTRDWFLQPQEEEPPSKTERSLLKLP
jgi:hypothetical protein